MSGSQSHAGVPRRRVPRKTAPPAFPTLAPLATRVERLRLERGLTQRVLAAHAGIGTNHYQKIAHAHANPTATVLLSLADALGVSVGELFGSTTPLPAAHRFIVAAELTELAAAHSRLTDIVERIARDELLPRRRRARRQHTR